MKKMNFEQMETIQGGRDCGSRANMFLAVAGLTLTVASLSVLLVLG
jgi:hypothetical protein